MKQVQERKPYFNLIAEDSLRRVKERGTKETTFPGTARAITGTLRKTLNQLGPEFPFPLNETWEKGLANCFRLSVTHSSTKQFTHSSTKQFISCS